MRRGLFLIVILGAAGVLSASPARDPKRLIAGQTVDLTPLVDWWNHPNGERPLVGWVHVKGRIGETNAYGWTVEGSVADSSSKRIDSKAKTSHTKFILKSPPVQEMTEFYQLEAKRKQLSTERDKLNHDIKRDAQQEKKLTERHPSATRRGHVRARKKDQQLKQVQSDEHGAHDRLETVEKEIKELDKKLAGFPDAEHYTVDCFALKLNQEIHRLPVYDHGVVLK